MYDKKAVAAYAKSDKGKLAHRNADKRRFRYCLLKRYGLTPAAYAQILSAQNHVCAACGEPERRRYKGRVRNLSVDHCHTTGKVRALLCYGCNSALGFLHDKKNYVARLLDYITLHEGETVHPVGHYV